MLSSGKEIAKVVGGKYKGQNIKIKGITDPEDVKPYHIVFIFNFSKFKKIKKLKKTIYVVKEDSEIKGEYNYILVDNPEESFVRFLNHFFPEPVKFRKGISEHAIVGNAELGKDVSIGENVIIRDGVSVNSGTVIFPNVYIGFNVTIGKNAIIYPNVSIYDRSILMDNVIIHAGAVIGSDGFGYINKDGKRLKIPQVGRVIIEDDVEIGANTTIDRSTIGETVIRKGTKIDNLVQIAHNVKVGKDTVIVAQAGVAGSVKIGDRVIIAGQAGIADHLNVEDDALILAQSGVMRDVKKGQIIFGYPADERMKTLRFNALIAKIPEILERIKTLEKKR